MNSRKERIEQREERIKEEEGASHGRDPEDLDPEMLEEDDADVVRANKAIKRRDDENGGDPPLVRPGKRLPPD